VFNSLLEGSCSQHQWPIASFVKEVWTQTGERIAIGMVVGVWEPSNMAKQYQAMLLRNIVVLTETP